MIDRDQRNRVWTWLYEVRREYQEINSPELEFTLWEYIEANYGVRIIMDHESMITGAYIVVDQEKFFVSKLAGVNI